MNEINLFHVVALPIFFGLLGFVEPCSIGSTLLVLKQIEGLPTRAKIVRTVMFAATRAVFIGLLGMLAAVLGAASLIFALLGSAAAASTTGASLTTGFVSLGLFGFALSLPLVVVVFFAPARAALDALDALSRRAPLWTGVVLVSLGAWSVWFALFVSLKA